MSTTLVRPGIHLMSRMPPTTLLRASTPIALRHLSTSIPCYKPSNALIPKKAQQDEQRGPIVGRSGPGSDGPHPSGTSPSFSLEPSSPTVADISERVEPVATVVHDHGSWTMMNPIYTEPELDCVKVVGREPVTVGDKAAHGMVKMLRRLFDMASGYIAKDVPASVLKENPNAVAELRKSGELLSDKDWLTRIILLESIAGVPGMVGGTLRHLRSLRLLRRDGGWIHTLLEEAENERMHLLTFLTVAQPGWFTRALVMAGQGVFYPMFFLTYLVAPKLAHRFVGALEEEAVRTYSHCISDIEKGFVPEWTDKPAPQIAIDYWRLKPNASLLDVIKAVRADEATHRFVNHSLADLDQTRDFNPFALAEAPAEIRGTKSGFTRDESAQFALETQRKLLGQSRGGINPPKESHEGKVQIE